MPQIIVCGSQSSGKSSTLESISGIAFPTAEGLCTRFATELILRRGSKAEIKIHIRPASTRSEEDKKQLAAFSEKATDLNDFPKLYEAAKLAMGLQGTDAKVFSADVLRIESISPDAPNLTLVDLPGLFGASDKNQSDDDAELVRNLVLSYMKQRRSIILAVVSADNPFANQPVTKFARDIDPTGSRTLGLITKPDRLDKGMDSERYYVEMAQNRNVKLVLGWHVLRNKSSLTADDTIEERDQREVEFFADSAWNVLEPSQLGINPLRERLREALWKQIEQGLPGVKSEVTNGIKDCRTKSSQLGNPRSTRREKHTYLHKISGGLSTLVQAAVDGVYEHPFFESISGQQDALDKRLRANIRKILADYADKMSLDGHALEVVEDDLEPLRQSSHGFVMRQDYLEEVKELMIECKSRELPGTFNPLVVGDLFARQCKPWASITQDLALAVHDAAATTFNRMLSSICDTNTKMRLSGGLIQPTLYRLRMELSHKLDELLKPHLSIHPITYNQYLTETVQAVQVERHHRKFDRISYENCKYDTQSAPDQTITVYLRSLLISLRQGTEPNVENYSACLAADVAQAYYKVNSSRFSECY